MKKMTWLACTALLFSTPFNALSNEIRWNVSPDFYDNEAALEISGAVCAGSASEGKWCYAVNDEKKHLQQFSLNLRTVTPGKTLKILSKKDATETNTKGKKKKFKEPDLEAISYDDGYVYFTGSHGLSRKKGKLQKSRYFVYRMPVDSTNGELKFSFNTEQPAPEIQRSNALQIAVKTNTALSCCREEPGKLNRLCNIEAMAVKDGNIYFGFRAPVLATGAPVAKFSIDEIFNGGGNSLQIFNADLGEGYGIRDMVAFDSGFLILAGAADDQQLPPILWQWKPGEPAHLLKVLSAQKGAKAEGLLLLNEQKYLERIADQKKATLHGLVFFDGLQNGQPTEYELISKP